MTPTPSARSWTVETWEAQAMQRHIMDEPSQDIYERIRYLVPGETDKETHLVVRDGDRVVGVAGLQINPWQETEYWLKHISVDESYRNQGIATALAEAAFMAARDSNRALKRSTLTETGRAYLVPVFTRLRERYPEVPFLADDLHNEPA